MIPAILEEHQTSTTCPTDFNVFWDRTLAVANEMPLNVSVERNALRSTPEVDVFDVYYDSFGGVRIAGWYCLPVNRPDPLPGMLYVPGYIGEPSLPKDVALQGYAAFGAAPRGKIRSNTQINPGYPGLLTYNIVDRNTYGYRGFFIDAIRAFQFLLGRDEVDATRVGVQGSSQGGGLTLLIAALCPEVRAASAGVPYLCGFKDSLALTKTYPYHEIQDYLNTYPDREEAVYDTLAYFDCINFGPRITCPILVNVGMQDNICPPETGYAAYQTIASADKAFYWYEGQGHDPGGATHIKIVDDFFAKHLQ
ncbi:MAG: acetylxylan esterase [Chloroflexota bacterium]